MTKKTRRAGRGTSKDHGTPTPFAEIMREQGMTVPTALEQSLKRVKGESADEVLGAAEDLLKSVLAGDCQARESALDLLTVDAMVTRAMEIAARDPKLLADFPELAMKRILAR